MKLLSLEELKIFLEKNDNAHDEMLSRLIAQVSQRIETHLNRNLSKTERIEKFSGGKKTYLLSSFPIDLDEDFTVVVDDLTYTIDKDFFVYPEEGTITFLQYTPTTQPQNVVITYTGGYTTSTTSGIVQVPDDLKRACILQCMTDFKSRNSLGLGAITMPDGSKSYFKGGAGELLSEVRQILKHYRKPPQEK